LIQINFCQEDADIFARLQSDQTRDKDHAPMLVEAMLQGLECRIRGFFRRCGNIRQLSGAAYCEYGAAMT
tara:strand:+ start:32154 stop:32363 length:210 start_codon:yes stop_codon:yes gene_type:complete